MEKNENDTISEEYIPYTRPLLFALLLTVEIPSILCTLLILLYFAFHWRLVILKQLQNHVILLLTIVSFLYLILDIPFSMNAFHTGYDLIRTLTFCLWWYWIDYTLLVVSLYLAAIASLQRHILIFHSHWFRLRRLRWMLHYVPLIFALLYPALFYLICIYFYPCEIILNETSAYCMSPCYLKDSILYNIDWILHTFIPVFVIGLANLMLVIRVIRSMKNARQQQRNTWKKQRKLTISLLVVSLLYFLLWFPSTIVGLVNTYIYPSLLDDLPDLYNVYNLYYFVGPLQPFMCFFALPELIKNLQRIIRLRRRVAPVMPFTMHNTRP
ncbi:hypothetical protein I4U23_011718 [Adineta vaga]|nr:hypothetical protein I4U23_011718 [Adineta vaga]